MIRFAKPENLNGAELLDELAEIGIVLDKVRQAPFLDDDNSLWLDIKKLDSDKAALVIAAHNGTIVAPDKTAARAALLQKLGITVDEAALLLS